MNSGVLSAAIATCACTVLALVLALRRERSGVASAMLALSIAIALWNGGRGLAAVAGGGAWQAAALRTATLGAIATAGLWLLLALRHRGIRRARGTAATVVALVPAFVYFMAELTSTSQSWLFRFGSTRPEAIEGWSASFTHLTITAATLLGITGTLLFAMAALRLWREGERRSAIVMGIAVVGQPLATLAAAAGILEGLASVSAATLAAEALVLALTALRYHVLEPPPLGHRQVIEHLRHGVLMASAAGEVLDHNAASERLLGLPPRGWSISEAIARLLPDERRAALRQALLRVETASESLTLQLQVAGNRHLEVSVRPILVEGRRVLGQVATLRDRSDEILFAETALRTQRRETIGTLAAGLAHEVNNPLAFVRANLCEVARLGERVEARRQDGSKLAEDLAELGELAGEALEGLDRIQRAVSDVRCLATTRDAYDGSVALDVALSNAVRLALPQAGGRITLSTRLVSDLPRIRGSSQLLVQAFVSLLMNSQQALEGVPDPRIEIESGIGEGTLWVRVRDNGPRIPEPLREHIFEPFFTTGVDPSGRGLGLSLAAGIARDHGGSLRVETGDGGASFLFTVAAPEPDARAES